MKGGKEMSKMHNNYRNRAHGMNHMDFQKAEKIRAIYRKEAIDMIRLAERFEVSPTQVRHIILGKIWTNNLQKEKEI